MRTQSTHIDRPLEYLLLKRARARNYTTRHAEALTKKSTKGIDLNICSNVAHTTNRGPGEPPHDACSRPSGQW